MASNVFTIIFLFFILCGALNLFFYTLAVYPAVVLCLTFMLMTYAFYYDCILIKK